MALPAPGRVMVMIEAGGLGVGGAMQYNEIRFSTVLCGQSVTRSERGIVKDSLPLLCKEGWGR